ncbi:molybdenum cofactor guanylyltransferase [Knoellia sp. Soil729]|uniref:molybdenum cofactor guanylyltransferase n=1 Tax=Knoellia sp. Soil729 TaxID=1736394 RepID=UPI0012E779EA|nr:NTP transferase domain-containing protein [Knoellia sp. Soil729]
MASSGSVIVLAGGTSRRFGSDKLAALLADGQSVLDRCLVGMPDGWPLVVVGPSRVVPSSVADRVQFVRESPAGSGPLAGVAAGVAAVTTDLVCVVAGDTPQAGKALPLLVSALEADLAVDAVVAGDGDGEGDGQANPLLAAYRTETLRGGVLDSPENRPARSLLSLAHSVLRVGDQARDVDTPEDLASLRRTLGS